MKTTLVVKDWSGHFSRAAMPGDAPVSFHSNVKHVPARKVMMSRGGGKAKEEHDPEHVEIRYNVFRPKGGKFERVRKLSEDVIKALGVLDFQKAMLQEQLQELAQKERSLLESAYDECPQLKMTDVRGYKNV